MNDRKNLVTYLLANYLYNSELKSKSDIISEISNIIVNYLEYFKPCIMNKYHLTNCYFSSCLLEEFLTDLFSRSWDTVLQELYNINSCTDFYSDFCSTLSLYIRLCSNQIDKDSDLYNNWSVYARNNKEKSLYKLALCHFSINMSDKFNNGYLSYNTIFNTNFYTNFDLTIPDLDFYKFYCYYQLIRSHVCKSFMSYSKCPCRSIIYSTNPCNFSHQFLSKNFIRDSYNIYNDSYADTYSDISYDSYYYTENHNNHHNYHPRYKHKYTNYT